jgi:hypothetical protein
MKENKEQWNHRERREEAPTLRDLTEEALELFLKVNGVKVKEAA